MTGFLSPTRAGLASVREDDMGRVDGKVAMVTGRALGLGRGRVIPQLGGVVFKTLRKEWR